MTGTVLTRDLFKTMLRAANAEISRQKNDLSTLDAATGDGDHGMAISAAMESACAVLNTSNSFAQMLQDMGWSAMSGSSGATSTLMGSFWVGMGTTLRGMPGDGENLSPADVAVLFAGGLANLRKQTKAQPGDKTLIDALLPAVDALHNQKCCKDQFAAAAKAAREGALNTVHMQAKHGRARNLGPKTIGHQDAGATSMAVLFEAFAATL